MSDPTGAAGYLDVYIPETLVENIAQVEVKLDNEQTCYEATSLDETWLLHFACMQNTQKVVVVLGDAPRPPAGTPLGTVLVWITLTASLAIVFALVYLGKLAFWSRLTHILRSARIAQEVAGSTFRSIHLAR